MLEQGQEITIFDRYDLTFAERKALTDVAEDVLSQPRLKAAPYFTDKYDPIIREYALKNKTNKYYAIEALDYIMALCRDDQGDAKIPALNKAISNTQLTLTKALTLTSK